MNLPSSVDSDIRGISSEGPAKGSGDCFSGGGDDFSGRGGGIESEENEVRVGEIEVLVPEGFHETVLSRLPEDIRIILCLAVRSRTFFSVFGKNSVKCVVINSLGGLCPKKLRSLDGFLEILILDGTGLFRSDGTD